MKDRYKGGDYVGKDDHWEYFAEVPEPVSVWTWLAVLAAVPAAYFLVRVAS